MASTHALRAATSGQGAAPCILVTGGAGFIGSHTCVELLNAGYAVVVVDNLVNSHRESLRRVERITNKSLTFYEQDVCDERALNTIFEAHPISAAIHFAALKAVAPVVRGAWAVEDLSTGIPSLHALIFRLHGDKQVLALWSRSQAGVIRADVSGARLYEIQSVLPNNTDVYRLRPGATEQTLEISDIPVLITGSKLALKQSN